MKTTPLITNHNRLGAYLVEFNGWQMPLYYTGIIDEHKIVRSRCGVFDICHMGIIDINGPGASKSLGLLFANNCEAMKCQTILYTVMCNDHGGVIDDLFVYKTADNDYTLVVNAATAQKDETWIRSHCLPSTNIVNRCEDLGFIAVQGPSSSSVMAGLLDAAEAQRVLNLPYFGFCKNSWNGIFLTTSRTGYTGEQGFEIMTVRDKTSQLWDALINLGASPIGLGARDSLRLEAGYSLYGHELTEDISPLEAGLAWTVKNPNDFIGKKALSSLPNTKTITGLRIKSRGVPRHGNYVYKGNTQIGRVTSGGFAPSLGYPIALALVDKSTLKSNGDITVDIRGQRVPADSVNRRFYKADISAPLNTGP